MLSVFFLDPRVPEQQLRDKSSGTVEHILQVVCLSFHPTMNICLFVCLLFSLHGMPFMWAICSANVFFLYFTFLVVEFSPRNLFHAQRLIRDIARIVSEYRPEDGDAQLMGR